MNPPIERLPLDYFLRMRFSGFRIGVIVSVVFAALVFSACGSDGGSNATNANGDATRSAGARGVPFCGVKKFAETAIDDLMKTAEEAPSSTFARQTKPAMATVGQSIGRLMGAYANPGDLDRRKIFNANAKYRTSFTKSAARLNKAIASGDRAEVVSIAQSLRKSFDSAYAKLDCG